MKDDSKNLGKTQKKSFSHNKIKAFFFLRHNNDIDHIVPVLYKWLSTQEIPTDVIITTQRKYVNDFRIKFLSQFSHVRVRYINDLLDKRSLTYLFNLFYIKYGTQCDNLFQKYPRIKAIGNKFFRKIASRIFGDTESAVAVFDWTITYFVNQMVHHAKQRNFITISLPHGDAPYVNNMETNRQFETLDDCWDGHQIFNMFDYVVVPNKLCQKRYDRYLPANKIKMLGSPRYSDEWMDIFSTIKNKSIITLGSGKIKLVLFLRNEYYPIFWEEVARTVHMISTFPNLFLAVKHHPRGKDMRDKFKRVWSLSNVVHVFEDIGSDALLEWADVVLDTGTSIVWEPIKNGKPVLSLEYLHANYTTSAYYIKNSEMKYRDQLYDFFKTLNNEMLKNFYNAEEKKCFIEEMINVPDNKVLERYVAFMKDCLQESYDKKHPNSFQHLF